MNIRCLILGHNKVAVPFVVVPRIRAVSSKVEPLPMFCDRCTHCGERWMTLGGERLAPANDMINVAWAYNHQIISWSQWNNWRDTHERMTSWQKY